MTNIRLRPRNEKKAFNISAYLTTISLKDFSNPQSVGTMLTLVKVGHEFNDFQYRCIVRCLGDGYMSPDRITCSPAGSN